jgi:predicted TIM-barrel fold metal-dependent hydrolase
MNLRSGSFVALALLVVIRAAAADTRASSYSADDFVHVRKFDSHVHANTEDHDFLDIARKDGFELLSINVDYPDFPTLERQATVAHELQSADPKRFHYLTAFSMKGFEGPTWTTDNIRRIDEEMAHGAVGVKVWKNVGMVEKDSHQRLIMLDDPRFDGLMNHLEAERIPLVAHQAEPKNCWLPLDAMTTENDRSYFREHPEYYMYLHPEQPSYETLLAARDRFVAKHPKLIFIGAHMASLEWSVDQLARFLDTYPNATADLAARMTQVQFQSKADRQKVRHFFVKYQDRLQYGTDLTENPPDPHARAQNPPSDGRSFAAEADGFWRSDWLYLATGDVQHIDAIEADVQGLALPKSVIDKIYYSNAHRVFRRLTSH